ncbi:Hypothetical predicted protein [Paramuricea clavata]|uniref:Uncharacterized protein n=1 Tax=Paramuricea clavata TaxID=317549 RepID=A0A7D9IGP1_PARCT|nr:Hypothetical predicted protein [Paramuricea clavata]
MPLNYAVSITPLLQMINVAHEVRHIAFADELSGAGRLVQLRSRWDNIVSHGPLLGYYPRADKSWLIVKPDLLVAAEEIFAGADVRISTDGHKYLGGYFGSEQGKNEYIRSLLERWSNQLRVLSDMRSMSLKQPTLPSCPDSVTDLPTISARFQIFNINCSRLTTSSTLNCFLQSRPAEIFPCKIVSYLRCQHFWESWHTHSLGYVCHGV